MNLQSLCIELKGCVLAVALLLGMYDVSAVGNQQLHLLESRLNQSVVKQPHLNIEQRLQLLTNGMQSDHEKAWLIYQWVIRHFRHDLKLSAKIGNPAHHSLDELFRLGGGSCAVYANVLHRLFDTAGLEVRTIHGTAKASLSPRQSAVMPINHVWNAVKIDGEWKMIDSTWGAGFVGDRGFERAPSDLFFLSLPEMAVLSHFDAKDQFGFQKKLGITPRVFASISEDAIYAAAVGFDPLQILIQQSRYTGMGIVKTFNHPSGAFKVIAAPIQGQLPRRSVTLVLESDVFDELVVVQGKNWTPLNKRGNSFTLEHAPEGGELVVMARRRQSVDYEALLAYQVH